MSTGIIVVIVVAVVVVAALVIGMMTVIRRRRLQQRFAPEYERVVGERDSKLKAEGELAQRECRVRDLTSSHSQTQRAQATRISGRVSRSGSSTRPRTLSQGRNCSSPPWMHSGTLDRYRAAEEISHSAAVTRTPTELSAS